MNIPTTATAKSTIAALSQACLIYGELVRELNPRLSLDDKKLVVATLEGIEALLSILVEEIDPNA